MVYVNKIVVAARLTCFICIPIFQLFQECVPCLLAPKKKVFDANDNHQDGSFFLDGLTGRYKTRQNAEEVAKALADRGSPLFVRRSESKAQNQAKKGK